MIIVNNLPFGSTESEVSIQNELNKSITELNRVSQLIKFYPLAAFDLPPDHMGAGLARKIGWILLPIDISIRMNLFN